MVQNVSLPGETAATQGASASIAKPRAEAAGGKDRTIRDSLEISEEGQKIINLARAGELAGELPDATADRAAFDAALEAALKDVERIGLLFGSVLTQLSGKTAFLPTGDNTDAERVEGSDQPPYDKQLAAALEKNLAEVRRLSDQVDSVLARFRGDGEG